MAHALPVPYKFTFMSLSNVFYFTNTNIALRHARCHSKGIANIHPFNPHSDLVMLVLVSSCLKDETTRVGHEDRQQMAVPESSSIPVGHGRLQKSPLLCGGTGRGWPRSCRGSDSGSQIALEPESVSCQSGHWQPRPQ